MASCLPYSRHADTRRATGPFDYVDNGDPPFSRSRARPGVAVADHRSYRFPLRLR